MVLSNPPTTPFTERTSNELEMVGGEIRWVCREIQSLELRNAPTTPFTERTSNKLEMSNFFDQWILDRAPNLG